MLSIDLGSANTVVCDSKGEVIFDEPTLIAYDKRSGRVVGIGNEARDVVGRVSGYVVVEKPIRDGRVSSAELLDNYIQALMRALSVKRFSRPKVIVALPASATLVEARSIMAAFKNAGIAESWKVDSVVASATGMGYDIYEPNGVMAVNLGAATTLSGIIAFGGVVAESHAFCGGSDLDQAIVEFVKHSNSASIDEVTAEEVKLALAKVTEEPPKYVSSLVGRDLSSGDPVQVEISEEDVRDAIADPVKRVMDVILDNLSHCPAELAQDLVSAGIQLCGGHSQLPGLAAAIRDAVKIPVYLAPEPRYSVAKGLAKHGAAIRA